MTIVDDACLNPIRPEEDEQQVEPVLEESKEVGVVSKEEEEEVQEEGQNTEEEIRKPKPALRPYTPTQQEIREHEVTHLPFRSWCKHCVFGKGVHSPHPKPDDKEKIGITISMDYCFMVDDDEGEEDLPGVLIMWDDNHECLWALPVDKKGPVEWVVKWIVEKLDNIGYRGQTLTIKTDQEPAIKTLKMAVAAKRVGATTPIESPVRESKCNGAVERAVRVWQGQLRAMKNHFEANIGAKLPVGHPFMGWLVL